MAPSPEAEGIGRADGLQNPKITIRVARPSAWAQGSAKLPTLSFADRKNCWEFSHSSVDTTGNALLTQRSQYALGPRNAQTAHWRPAKGAIMKFASTRLIAADIKAMVGFYELVTGISAEWLAPVFAEIVTPSATLAIGSVETVKLFKEGSAEPAANRSAIIEFMVADVDAEFARLKDQVEVVHEPKMMPWGNRSGQFRDPEGTTVALFTPTTEAAKQRFASR